MRSQKLSSKHARPRCESCLEDGVQRTVIRASRTQSRGSRKRRRMSRNQAEASIADAAGPSPPP
eukprot:7009393-Prorocentrum_lima.AAC.1